MLKYFFLTFPCLLALACAQKPTSPPPAPAPTAAASLAPSLQAEWSTRLSDRYPPNQSFQLSNQTKIQLPFRAQGHSSSLFGIVDVPALNDLLAKEDLVAVPINAQGLPDANGIVMVGLAVHEYSESTVGPYKEFLLTTIVKSLKPTTVERFGVYSLDIKTDTALSQLAGRELGGYPITRAHVKTEYKDGQEFSVSIGKVSDVKGYCSDSDKIPMVSKEISFNLVSPYKIRRTWYEYRSRGSMGFKAFDPQKDSFSANNPLIKKLKFTPAYWIVGKNIETVVTGGN